MKNEWEIFGERLKASLNERGVSYRWLADKTGITLTTICRYANSERVPRASEILKCADALHVTCDYLVGLSNTPECTSATEPKQQTGRCVWCDGIENRRLRIEFYWIDDQGNTASFSEPHMVATGIAKYCPECGRKLMMGEGV